MATRKARGRRNFVKRSYKKRFVLSMEGTVTEPRYFQRFGRPPANVVVDYVRGRRSSSPVHVLDRMEKHLKVHPLEAADEAWLIVDRDSWSEAQFAHLARWVEQNKSRHHLAVSNPSFEYWLLLHFESGRGVQSLTDCKTRLLRYLPQYAHTKDLKRFDANHFTLEHIQTAVRNGRQRAKEIAPMCDSLHHCFSDVFLLVEKLLA